MIKRSFEHKNNQILPFKKFILRVIKYFLFSIILIAFSLGIGTIGYHYYANISWVDAFYNASLILTGMGPVDEMPTDSAKLFASFYALFSGIAFLSTVAVIFAPIAHRLLHVLHIKEEDWIHYLITYILVFFGIFFEGELILLSAVIAAHQGLLNIWIVICITIITTISSDIFYFYLGKHKAKKWIVKSKFAAKFEKVNERLQKK